jgi:hypothetical protein
VERSDIQAYLWANRAARGGNDAGRELRDGLVASMSEPDLAEARRLALDW